MHEQAIGLGIGGEQRDMNPSTERIIETSEANCDTVLSRETGMEKSTLPTKGF